MVDTRDSKSLDRKVVRVQVSLPAMTLIEIKNCAVKNRGERVLENVSWRMQSGEAWLITGANTSGKDFFLSALANLIPFETEKNANQNFAQKIFSTKNSANENLNSPANKNSANEIANENSFFFSHFEESVELVSLEKAAHIIQEERENDESEYSEDGFDAGRTSARFIAEALVKNKKDVSEMKKIENELLRFPEIKLCGIENILHRGIKFLSTGEIRRTLLARALLSKKKLIILSEPFAGLDVQSRKIMSEFFNEIFSHKLNEERNRQQKNFSKNIFPHLLLAMERFAEIPNAITNVLEFDKNAISFCGTKKDYEKILFERKIANEKNGIEKKNNFEKNIKQLHDAHILMHENKNLEIANENASEKNSQLKKNERTILVEMKNVNVGWDGKLVLRNLNWTLYEGEHFLILGPNGSGKTTFLELITGDNTQVYANDVSLFGKRRGTGETMWDIKSQLGIVSYRLHVEYRMLGNTRTEDVLLSGFYDSIGLYEKPTDTQIDASRKWLAIAGFLEKKDEPFSHLSYGEQRAILILRAVIKNPRILVLDEPCHALDEENRNAVLQLLETIAELGSTTLLHVTHESDEILPCEKHILELKPNETPMYIIRQN